MANIISYYPRIIGFVHRTFSLYYSDYILLVASAKLLHDARRTEKNADVREKILACKVR